MMYILIQASTPDYLDPALGIPLAIILWTLLLIIVLVQLRRAKVRRNKAARIARRIAYRESYIQIAEEHEEAYIESLKPKNQDSRR